MYSTQDITADILSAPPQKQFFTAKKLIKCGLFTGYGSVHRAIASGLQHIRLSPRKMLISREGLKLFFESNIVFGGEL